MIVTILQVSEAFSEVVDKQVLDKRFGIIVEFFGEAESALEDVLIDDQRIIVSKGVDSRNHLINQNAKSPPIHWLTMPLIL